MEEISRPVMQNKCGEIGMVCRALFWMTLAGLLVYAGYGVWMAAQPGAAFTLAPVQLPAGFAAFTSFDGGAATYFAPGVLDEAAAGAPKTVHLLAFWVGLVSRAFVLGLLGCLRRIFLSIDRSGTPFTAQAVRLVRWIGLCLFAMAECRQLLLPVLCLLFGVGGGSFTVISGSALLALGFAFCLSYIFAYGASLQRESDETL